jgi:hypothetical protein
LSSRPTSKFLVGSVSGLKPGATGTERRELIAIEEDALTGSSGRVTRNDELPSPCGVASALPSDSFSRTLAVALPDFEARGVREAPAFPGRGFSSTFCVA